MSEATSGSPDATSAKPFVINREFQAPRQLVWDAWTRPEHLAKWMSPPGLDTLKAEMDFRVGGTYHYGLRAPGGMEMWGKISYREIRPPERLVYVQSFSDAHGGLGRHPGEPDWPLEMLTTITLSELAGKARGTALTLQWLPINASPKEILVFNAAHAGMDQGWGGSLQKLEAFLATGAG